MIENENTAIIISTHMTSPHLPGAAMADLLGEPMVVHAWRTAKSANIGEVLVAAPSMAVLQAVQKAGGDAIIVSKSSQKPLAQAAEALGLRDPDLQFSHVLVIPANYPLLDALTLRRCLAALNNQGVDMATAAGVSPSLEWNVAISKPFSVTVPLDGDREVAFARNFGQGINSGDWHHINITALRRQTLDLFKSIPDPEFLEVAEALQHGAKIAVVKVDDRALYINTPQALDLARRHRHEKSS